MADFKFLKGNIDTIILNALYSSDKYGYEITKEIKEKTSYKYEIKQPTLYAYLKRLESDGLILAYWGEESHGGRRKYYKLTERGKTICEQNMFEWEFHRTVFDSLVSDQPANLETVEAPSDEKNVFLGTKRPRKRDLTTTDEQEELNRRILALQNAKTEEKIERQQSESAAELNAEKAVPTVQAAEHPTTESLPKIENQPKAEPSQETIASASAEQEAPHEPRREAQLDLLSAYEQGSRQEDLHNLQSVRNGDTVFLDSAKSEQQQPPQTFHRQEVESATSKQYKQIIGNLVGDQLSKAESLPQQQTEPPADDTLTLSEIADQLAKDGYRMRMYNRTASKYVPKPMLYVNKLKMYTTLLALAFVVLVNSILLAATRTGIVLYATYTICAAIPFLIAVVNYINYPTKRIPANFNLKKYLFRTLYTFIAATLLCLAVNFVLLKTYFGSSEWISLCLAPILTLSAIPIGVVIYHLLLKRMVY